MVSSSQGVPMLRSLLRPIACTLAVAILLMLGATTGSAFAHEIQHAAHHNAGMHATGICAWMCATLKRLKMAESWALALALVVLIGGASEALASCGSAACFLLTGEEGAVQLEGKLSVGLTYAYTISKLQSGTNGFVTAVDQEERRLIMNEHAEHRTILEVTTLDVNYGLTNNLTLELLVPYKHIKHTHIIERGSPPTGEGEYEAFQDAGIGDVRVNTKYSFLPWLRSLIVYGFGVDLPTG